ncbi:MAG: MFS transporter [Thermoproteus sp. AZ2]|uniref:MFS transporter n=1 Tax=Thermoproteus sp. AZ2 TaxID=1609232 RepID=A0ACC6V261_9CREN
MPRWDRDVWLLLASRGVRSVAGGALGVITSLYLRYALHLSLTEIGIFFGVGAFLAPLLSLVFGRLGDRYSRKAVLLLTLSFLPIATAILLATSSYPLLLLAAALGGFGTAGALASGSVGAVAAPVQTAILADKTEGLDRSFVYAVFNLVSGVSSALGALLANLSYREAFLIALALSAASLAVVLPIREPIGRRGADNGRPALSAKELAYIRRFAAVGALNGTAQGLVTSFLPIIFKQMLYVPNGVVGDIFFVGGLAAAFASLAAPWFSRILGLRDAIIALRVISTAALMLIPFSASLPMAIATYVAYVMFRVSSLAPQQALMMELVGRGSRSTATGINQAARLFPSALATTAAGAMLDYLPIPVPFSIAVAINLANIALYKKYFPNPRPAQVGAAALE